MADLGHEEWDEVRDCILPVLKHRTYVKADGPTKDLLTSEWLADVVICYAIHNKKIFRFVTNWDVRRWETDARTLHDLAIANVSRLPWPSRCKGARVRRSGHVIVLECATAWNRAGSCTRTCIHSFRARWAAPSWPASPIETRWCFSRTGESSKRQHRRQFAQGLQGVELYRSRRTRFW